MSKGMSVIVYAAIFAAAFIGFIMYGAWKADTPVVDRAVSGADSSQPITSEQPATPSVTTREEKSGVQNVNQSVETAVGDQSTAGPAGRPQLQPQNLQPGAGEPLSEIPGTLTERENAVPDTNEPGAGIDNRADDVPPDGAPSAAEDSAAEGAGFTDTPEETFTERSERARRAVDSPGVAVPSLGKTYGADGRVVHPDAMQEYYDTPPGWMNPDPERAETQETRKNRLGESLKQLRQQ